jgi:hypothetical protein
MSKKSVIVLWILVFVLAASVTALKLRKGDTGEANTNRHRGETVLASFPVTEVSSIQIKGVGQSVTLNKTADGWVVAERNNYPANFNNINNLLRTLEKVKINNAIEAGPTYGARFGMDLTSDDPAKHGIQLTFTKADQSNVATIFLGKDSTGGGRYIQNAADTSGIYVVSESFPTATPDPKSWLQEDFIAVDKITSIAVTAAGKPDQVDWKITRADETAEFALEGAQPTEKLDTSATSLLSTILSSARFQDVSTVEVATVEQSPQRRVATIGTKDGFTYTVSMLEKPVLQVPDALAKPGSEPPTPEENFQVTLKVEGNFATERVKAEGETPEDAKSKDETFQASLKALQEKLKTEQAYQGRVYELSKNTIDALLKSRTELIAPPVSIGNPAAEATTPPVSFGQ